MPKRYLYYAGLAACSLSASQTARAQATRTEAQAFVTDSSARFVFPLDRRKSYSWDLPIKGAQSGMPEFSWMVAWSRASVVPGQDPVGLWLITRWKPTGPRTGTLADLIRGYTLDAMIECLTCDGALYRDPERDTTTVFATVEGGRVVFNVRSRKAMHRIFPVLPQTVTFSRSIRQTRSQYGPRDSTETQVVIANCTAGRDRRRRLSCVVPPVVIKRPPDPDSAAVENAPRQVYVPVIRFADATLLKHVSVRIKRIDGTVWKVMSTGSLGAIRLSQPPIGPLLLQALCPQRPSKPRTISGSVFVQITSSADTSVHLIADPTICPR